LVFVPTILFIICFLWDKSVIWCLRMKMKAYEREEEMRGLR
jgi:hypothetical protein